jgi:DHA1 family multidrug resistance protein B-like MFS transporter
MALEVQINYFINVRVSEGFPQQTLFTIGSWAARVTGVEILGILRAENTLLVVVLALVVLGTLKRLNDRFRLYVGVGCSLSARSSWRSATPAGSCSRRCSS